MGFFQSVIANWGQFAAAFCIVFVIGIANEKPLTMKAIIEIFKGAISIVVIFAFLSSGKGCSSGGGYSECSPAGPSIYNDC